jgi:hypothetical protein
MADSEREPKAQESKLFTSIALIICTLALASGITAIIYCDRAPPNLSDWSKKDFSVARILVF